MLLQYRFLLLKIIFLLSIPLAWSNEVHVYFSPGPSTSQSSAYVNITNFIAGSKSELLIAMHELKHIEICLALIEAKKNNTDVKVLLEKKYLEKDFNNYLYQLLLQNDIRVIADKRKSGLMHSKYLVRDRKDVLSGSANFTYTGIYYNFNDIILFLDDTTLAKDYLRNFNQLILPPQRRSEKAELNLALSHTAGFSREHNIVSTITDLINDAENSVSFAYFVFSSGRLNTSLLNNTKIQIDGILDNQFSSPAFARLWPVIPQQRLSENGHGVFYDPYPAKIHHKFMLIDEAWLLTGSMNLSENAQNNNNENILFINDSEIISQYKTRLENLLSLSNIQAISNVFSRPSKEVDKQKLFLLKSYLNTSSWMNTKTEKVFSLSNSNFLPNETLSKRDLWILRECIYKHSSGQFFTTREEDLISLNANTTFTSQCRHCYLEIKYSLDRLNNNGES